MCTHERAYETLECVSQVVNGGSHCAIMPLSGYFQAILRRLVNAW